MVMPQMEHAPSSSHPAVPVPLEDGRLRFGPRVQPIDKPTSWKLKLLYLLAPLEFGKVPVAFKVVYARIPGFILRHLKLLWYAEDKLSLEKRLVHLVQVWGSRTSGDAFGSDMFLYYGLKGGVAQEVFDALPEYERHSAFVERERAALAFVQESIESGHVADETFARALRSFDDVQIVELTFLAAVTHYINMISIPLRLPSDDFTGRLRRGST